MSGPPFLCTFGPGSLPRDALETMLEWEPEKPQKNHFLDPSFMGRFETVFNAFTEPEFSMFSEPLFYHLFGPRDA